MDGKYCAYLRKSRADEVREKVEERYDALAHHRQALEALAARMGVPISRWYSDGIKSGERIEGREGMAALLSDVQAGRWDGVLCMEVERLTRGDLIDQGTVLRSFCDTSTLIVTPQKVYDPASEADMEYFEFGMFMSRREFKTINKRLVAGRLAAVREGQYIASEQPYGYDKVRVDGMKTLSPNADAEHVRAIFDMYVAGESYRSIARKLDAYGAVPYRGGKWNPNSVRNIVRNPTYIGKTRWNTTKQEVYYEDGRRRTRTVGRDGILADGLHPAIIDMETWERAQARSGAAPVRKAYEHRNPYGRVLVCAECGKALHYNDTGHAKFSYYTHLHSPEWCKTKGCPTHVLDEAFAGALEAIAADLEASIGAPTSRSQVSADDYRAEAERLKRAISDNFDRMERGVISEDDFVSRKAELEARIAESLELAREADDASADRTAEKAMTVRECIRAVADTSLPVESRRRAIWAVVERIEYRNRAPHGKHEVELSIFLR